jgi:hypothetical protein
VAGAVVRHAPDVRDEAQAAASFAVLVLAAATYGAGPAWTAWLDEQLAATAARLPLGEVTRWFAGHVGELRRVLPACPPVGAKAIALCASAV